MHDRVSSQKITPRLLQLMSGPEREAKQRLDGDLFDCLVHHTSSDALIWRARQQSGVIIIKFVGPSWEISCSSSWES